MNTLIYSSFNLYPHRLGVMLNELQESINQGENVYFLSCHNSYDGCGQNMDQQRSVCYRCKVNEDNFLKEIDGHFNRIQIADFISPEGIAEATKQYEQNRPIRKDTVVDQFDVGEALYSSYISKTKLMDEHAFNTTNFSRFGFINSLVLYQVTKEIIQKYNIEKILIFNGRWDYYRAVMRAGINSGITVYTYELIRRADHIKRNTNDFPHNFLFNQTLVNQLWASDSGVTLEEKIKAGDEYFLGKRDGNINVDRFAYAKNFSAHSLPDNFDENLDNYVFFNNSDFEFSALNKDYAGPIFIDQYEAIKYLVHYFGNQLLDKNLYLRLHPNLVSGPPKYIDELMAFDGLYKNVAVIHPSSKVSSYALIDACRCVLSYRSTIGLEACYWSKPVITLGKSFYQHADVSYNPQTQDELNQLLNSVLPPKEKINAVKWAYFFIKGGVKTKFFTKDSLATRGYFKNREMYTYSLVQNLVRLMFRSIDKLKLRK